MNSTRYLLHVVRALIMLAWTPAIAFATVVALQPEMPDLVVDWMLVVISVVIATLAGATALFIRINNLLMRTPEQPMVRPWLFAVAHMSGSWSAGIAGFLVGRAQHLDVWTSLLGVLFMSFLGAKALEIAAERWLPVVRPKE